MKPITLLVSILLLLFSFTLVAEVQVGDIEDALTPFPRSQVVEQSNAMVEDYAIALGEMKKVRDIWEPERERRLAGDLQRQTLQIPEGHRAQEAFDFYRRKMRNFNARVLFECEARGCGSSNAWANQHFDDKTLYGLDGEQSYGIYEIIDEQGFLNYVALYTVMRGNRRVYAHTEWLRTDNRTDAAVAPSVDEVSNYLAGQGYYVLGGISLEDGKLIIDNEHLQAIADAIRFNRRMNFYLVGHSYGAGSLEQHLATSLDYAEQMQNILVTGGIRPQRISVHGVGSLSPARQMPGEQTQTMRIELVVDRS